MSFFQSQAEYERYHSPECREQRRQLAERNRETTVSKALLLLNEGDREGARQELFEGGISDDGIAEYLRMWQI